MLATRIDTDDVIDVRGIADQQAIREGARGKP